MGKIKDVVSDAIFEASLIPTRIELERDAKKLQKVNEKQEKILGDKPNAKKIIPVVASDMQGVDQAVKNKEKVIIINNKDLFSTIKENVDKDSKFYNNRTLKNIVSGVAIVGAAILPILEIPVSVGVSMYATKSLGDLFSKRLRQYTWIENEAKGLLILVKAKGENAFEDTSDVIDYENMRKVES